MLPSLALMVVVVVDQLRTDELLRARTQLNPAGIGRLVNKGIFYDDAHHGQFFNMTCPGHVSLSTGAYPALTGIMVNDSWDAAKHKPVYCVQDDASPDVDAPEEPKHGEFGVSGRRIMTTTVGDEAKALFHDDTRVITISLKDRAAVSMAGHLADGVYFFARYSHVWTTSKAYLPSEKRPDWLIEFNKKVAAKDTDPQYGSSEAALEDTTALALQAAKEWKLGHHSHPDQLWVSYSTHDFVSHAKGDDSPELATTLVEEDKQIGRLIEGLLMELGPHGKIMVTLSADHGAGTHLSEYPDLPGGRIKEKAFKDNINDCMAKVGFSDAVESVTSMNIYLSRAIPAGEKLNLARKTLKSCVERASPGVLTAFTRGDILAGLVPQVPWLKNLVASYSPDRGPDVIGVLKPYWNSNDITATAHETSYDYDSWVPLAVWWPGVHHKDIHERVSTLSLAPTLARILNTRRPSGAMDGYLTDVLDALDKAR